MLFAKIIRDADKIDIMYEATEIFWKGKEKEVENTDVSDYVFDFVKNNETVINSNQTKANSLDKVVATLALVFDLNFDISFKIIKNQDYINKILDRFDIKSSRSKARMEEILKIINDYIDANS